MKLSINNEFMVNHRSQPFSFPNSPKDYAQAAKADTRHQSRGRKFAPFRAAPKEIATKYPKEGTLLLVIPPSPCHS